MFHTRVYIWKLWLQNDGHVVKPGDRTLIRFPYSNDLTHWGRVTHICISDLTSIGSDNGLSPGRRQTIIRTDAGILLIRPLGTKFSEFLDEILIFSFKKMRLKVSSAKRQPFCLRFNKLKQKLVHRNGNVVILSKYWSLTLTQNCRNNVTSVSVYGY